MDSQADRDIIRLAVDTAKQIPIYAAKKVFG
jgi:hypothetical protein